MHGDSFAGNTFRSDFETHGVTYVPSITSKSDLYELFEAPLNAGEVELLDQPTLIEQATCLVWRGQRIDHETGGHDDWINAVAGVSHVLRVRVHEESAATTAPIICRTPRKYFGDIGSGYMAAPHLASDKSNWPVW